MTTVNNKGLTKGTPVQILIGHDTVNGIFSHTAPNGKAYVHVQLQGEKPKGYERSFDKVWKIGEAVSNFELSGGDNVTLVAKGKTFEINERFTFLSSLVRMVIKNLRVSLIITGEGGLGKTYTVMEQIKQAGLYEGVHYVVIKGFSTAKGLYNTLFDHRDKLIIFDDCDEVLKNDIAKNILKGALDSYDVRKVSWISQAIGSDYPTDFIFEGRIIFISNMDKNKIDQAILSRASNVDLTMSVVDKLARMEKILPTEAFKGEVSMKLKNEAFEVLKKHAHACSNLNLRTLIEIIDYRASGEENWEELAEYVIYAS